MTIPLLQPHYGVPWWVQESRATRSSVGHRNLEARRTQSGSWGTTTSTGTNGMALTRESVIPNELLQPSGWMSRYSLYTQTTLSSPAPLAPDLALRALFLFSSALQRFFWASTLSSLKSDLIPFHVFNHHLYIADSRMNLSSPEHLSFRFLFQPCTDHII